MTTTIQQTRGKPGTTATRLRAVPRNEQPREIHPRTRPATAPEPDTTAMTPVPVTWGGHEVDAPGFSQDQFERAMTRAFVDDLHLKPLGRDTFLVHRPNASLGHRTTRETCSCPAGQHDVPCKHRAMVISHLDIRMPERARRWAKQLRARERQAAAAKVA